MAWAPLSLAIFSLSWSFWHPSNSMMCYNSRDQVFPAPTEPLLFRSAFYLNSHSHHWQPGALDLSDVPWWLLDQPPYPLFLLPPALHATRGVFPSLTRHFPTVHRSRPSSFPGYSRPPCSGPSLYLQLPLPHQPPSSGFLKHQPDSGLGPWAMYPFLCWDHSCLFYSRLLPTFFSGQLLFSFKIQIKYILFGMLSFYNRKKALLSF